MPLAFHAVEGDRWDDLARLFEERGGPKYCWCMAWRTKPPEGKSGPAGQKNAALKAALRSCVDEGTPIGILGYEDGAAIAWCSIAPRSTHRPSRSTHRPLGGPDEPSGDPDPVWSLTCFYIKRTYRGRGVTAELIKAAVAQAKQSGARIVEAYPVDPDSPSYRFMGFIGVYEKLGFQRVGEAGTRRHVVRLSLT